MDLLDGHVKTTFLVVNLYGATLYSHLYKLGTCKRINSVNRYLWVWKECIYYKSKYLFYVKILNISFGTVLFTYNEN